MIFDFENKEFQVARQDENTNFVCANCARHITKLTNGSYRNHCPFCLYSLHVDVTPGDRVSSCCALMEPVGLRYSGKKGWQIVHQCIGCGHLQANKVATNTIEPDDIAQLTSLGIGPD